jgi:hypothetical protein
MLTTYQPYNTTLFLFSSALKKKKKKKTDYRITEGATKSTKDRLQMKCEVK